MEFPKVVAAFFLAVLAFSPPSRGDFCSVTYDNVNRTYKIHSGLANDAVSWANFTDEVQTTGWSYLNVTTNGSYADSIQSYAAGLVEGFITDDLIYKHWMNTVDGYCTNEVAYCSRLLQFLQTNLYSMKLYIAAYQFEPYWHQVSLILDQLSGLEDGYARRQELRNNKKTRKLREFSISMGFIMIQIFGDLEDLEVVLNKSANLKRVKGSGSCSGLIKVLPGNAEIFVSQDSWNTYQSMLRVLKRYNFNFHQLSRGGDLIAGKEMTFSSYPGLLISGDDFYLINSGLVTLETTIGNGNSDLWEYVKPVGSVLEWIRCMVANRLSTNGSDWTKTFIQYNSGTYNNQWMVVDFKLFQPKQKLQDNLLWVIEQLPKYYQRADLTDVLRKQQYWPSYNSPYFEFIFNMSGAYDDVLKYGDWFSYNKTPRALIFKRDHVKVTSLQTMIKLMRYNDYKNDKLSRCNCTPPYSAENAISARSDLNPKNGTYPFPSLGHRSHGGIDMKVSSYSMMSADLSFVAIGGPTYDQQPPFRWSTSDFSADTPHLGHPDLWAFKPVLFDGRRRPTNAAAGPFFRPPKR